MLIEYDYSQLFSFRLAERDPSWRDHAACKGMDTNIFFPGRAGDISANRAVERAKEICAGCSVREQCAEFGMDEIFGVWGGLSGRDRKRLNAGRDKRKNRPFKHGTPSGYQNHRNRGEDPCGACLWAMREYVRKNNEVRNQQGRNVS